MVAGCFQSDVFRAAFCGTLAMSVMCMLNLLQIFDCKIAAKSIFEL